MKATWQPVNSAAFCLMYTVSASCAAETCPAACALQPEDVSSRSSKLQAAPAVAAQQAAGTSAGAAANAEQSTQVVAPTQPVAASADGRAGSRSRSMGTDASDTTLQQPRSHATMTTSQKLEASRPGMKQPAPAKPAAAGTAPSSKAITVASNAAGTGAAGAAGAQVAAAGASAAASDDDVLLQEVLAAAAGTLPRTPASGIIASRSAHLSPHPRLLCLWPFCLPAHVPNACTPQLVVRLSLSLW